MNRVKDEVTINITDRPQEEHDAATEESLKDFPQDFVDAVKTILKYRTRSPTFEALILLAQDDPNDEGSVDGRIFCEASMDTVKHFAFRLLKIAIEPLDT